MPLASKTWANIRRWLSVSTVPPDFDDTTSTVRLRSPASASETWPGSVVSSTTSGWSPPHRRPPGRRGADDLGGERRAAHAGEHDAVDAVVVQVAAQGRELVDQRARGLVQRTQLRRFDASGSASGPQRVGSPAASFEATPSPTSFSTSGGAALGERPGR